MDAKTLSVGGDEILQVTVEKYRLHVKYLDKAWAGWAEFQEDVQYRAIQKDVQDKLAQAEGRLDKGKGSSKGPH